VNGIRRYYELVSDLISYAEFYEQVEKKIKWSEGLLEEDTAARLVAAEMGRKELKIREIGSLLNGESALIEGEIEEVGAVKEFTGRSGKKNRVVNILISDGTGMCRISLWGRDVSIAKKMRPGMWARVVNGKVKVSSYGTEVSLGKFSSLWIGVEGELFQVK
jgi:ssDNA-binding replication factor A large subunit